jgi:hypothetical protein
VIATHVGVLVHDDVVAFASAVHVIVPPPEWPSSQITCTAPPVVICEPVPPVAASLFEFATTVAMHVDAVHMGAALHVGIAWPSRAVHVMVALPVM